MRGEITIDRLPVATVGNQVLVRVHDIFSGFTTKGGIQLVNLTDEEAWADSQQFNISEFAVRKGEVVVVPERIHKGSFDYSTVCEVEPGDTVYWSLISFKDHVPLNHDGVKYLLVDYHELLLKQSNGSLQPINGNGLFLPVSKEEQLLAYTVQTKVTDEWVLWKKPKEQVVYDRADRNFEHIWEEGDHVRLLVGSNPFKVEGDIRKELGADIYACPMKYIICTV